MAGLLAPQEERGKAPCPLLQLPPVHPAPQTKQTGFHGEAGPTWKCFSRLLANQVPRPPSLTWKPSPQGQDDDSEFTPPLPRLPSLQLKVGSEGGQSSGLPCGRGLSSRAPKRPVPGGSGGGSGGCYLLRQLKTRTTPG